MAYSPELIGGELECTVKTMDHRQVKRGKQLNLEYLVKWLGYGDEHDTFEPAHNLEIAAEEVTLYWQIQPAAAESSWIVVTS